MTTTMEANRAEEQAKAQLESIVEVIAALRQGETDNDDDAIEAARQTIMEDPLSVEVRSDWQAPGETLTPSEFCILLCTGGPAVRIVGDLDEHGQPDRARIEYQDWYTPWTELVNITTDERVALLDYCQQFWFA